MFEFNMSPAVLKRDAAFDQRFDGGGGGGGGGVAGARREWLMQHDEAMLRESLDIVLPPEDRADPGQWDLAGEFEGTGFIV